MEALRELECGFVRRPKSVTRISMGSSTFVTLCYFKYDCCTGGRLLVVRKGKTLPAIGWHASREGVCVVGVGFS